MKYVIVEWEEDKYGFRFWSKPMPEADLNTHLDWGKRQGYTLSDIDEPTEEYLARHLAEGTTRG